MPACLDVRTASGARLVVLDQDRITAGREPHNHVALSSDTKASRMHASFERYGTGWCLHDLGSRNGTFVNGQRIWRERVLHDGDEIRIGDARIVFHTGVGGGSPALTEAGAGILRLTPREFDVLAALCSPILAGDMFTGPASTRDIAQTLVVTQAAVKQHLSNLYDKFGVDGATDQRRTRLANEAMSRGVLTLPDLSAWAARNRPAAPVPPPQRSSTAPTAR
jgi:hypothetical protein